MASLLFEPPYTACLIHSKQLTRQKNPAAKDEIEYGLPLMSARDGRGDVSYQARHPSIRFLAANRETSCIQEVSRAAWLLELGSQDDLSPSARIQNNAGSGTGRGCLRIYLSSVMPNSKCRIYTLGIDGIIEVTGF